MGTKLYKAVEWRDEIGRWHCADTGALERNSGVWYIPARVLGITPAEYVNLVKTKYDADISFNSDCSFVFVKWENQNKMRLFKNYLNKVARERNFCV